MAAVELQRAGTGTAWATLRSSAEDVENRFKDILKGIADVQRISRVARVA